MNRQDSSPFVKIEYPTLRRLARANRAQLWEWYARLPKPSTPGERKVLVETMRRLDLIPELHSPGEHQLRSARERVIG